MRDDQEIETYGDENIASYNGEVPRWLIWNYIFWPLVGLIILYFFWNGSYGWLDRGYWNQLQRAANTTFPIMNQNDLQQKQTEVKL